MSYKEGNTKLLYNFLGIKDSDIDRLSPKHIELFEIAQKCGFYKKRSRWFLRPVYEIAYFLILCLVKVEIRLALDNEN